MESNEIYELKTMVLEMKNQLEQQTKQQSNKIEQLEKKLDYLTQGPSTTNVKLIEVTFCFTYIYPFQGVITTGKNRMKIFVNDLSASLIPNDEIKGLYLLCQTILRDELKSKLTWREHSKEIRQNIIDLISELFSSKHSNDVFN